MNKPIKLKMRILLLIILMSNINCETDYIPIVKTGCLPLSTIRNSEFLGIKESFYYYAQGRMTNNDDYEFIYKNNRIVEITLGNNRYEEYSFNSDNFVSETKQYRKDSDDEGFKLVLNYEYTYENGRLVKAHEKVDNEKLYYYFNDNENIDSLITKNIEGDIIQSEHFTYDAKNNSFKNICHPLFNYNWWITKRTPNNIISYLNNKPGTFNNPSYYDVEIEYNEFDYPISTLTKFSSGSSSLVITEYIDCE